MLLYLQSNTYQGVLITDGEVSYTIFIYRCGLLENGAVGAMGYYINDTHFQEHSLSNSDLSSTVACQSNTSDWSALMYSLNGTGHNDYMVNISSVSHVYSFFFTYMCSYSDISPTSCNGR